MRRFSLLVLKDHLVRLFPRGRGPETHFPSASRPYPLVLSDLLLQVRGHLANVAQVELTSRLAEADRLEVRHRGFKERLKLMPAQTPLDESLMLPVNADFPLLTGFSEHQVLILDAEVDRLTVINDLPGLPRRSVGVRVSLGPRPFTTGPGPEASHGQTCPGNCSPGHRRLRIPHKTRRHL